MSGFVGFGFVGTLVGVCLLHFGYAHLTSMV